MATSKAPVSLRDELGAVSAPQASGYFNLLIYGDSGVGKTHFAGTADDDERTSPLLFLDCEGGTATIRHKPEIDVVEIRSMDKLQEVQNKLVMNPGYYKTIAVDSLTELQKIDMAEIMRKVMQSPQGRNREEEVPSQREYLISQAHIRMTIRSFRDLEANVIFTALARTDQDVSDLSVATRPNLPNKQASEAPQFFDMVGYYYADIKGGEVVRKLQLQGTKKVKAKDRLIGGKPVIDNPTIPLIWSLLNDASS